MSTKQIAPQLPAGHRRAAESFGAAGEVLGGDIFVDWSQGFSLYFMVRGEGMKNPPFPSHK